MDWLEILVTSAAVVSVLAFVGLGIVLLRQGHSLRRLQEQVAAGGTDDATAPSMDRLRRLRAEARAGAERPDGAAGAERPPVHAPGRGRRLALIGGLAALVLALAAGGAWFLFLRDDSSAATATRPAPAPPPAPPPPSDTVPANPPPLANKADYTIAVLNGSGVTGFAANRVVPRVQQAGYNVGKVDNARRDNVAVSMVMYAKGKRVVAQNVASDLGIKKAPPLGPLAAGRTDGADAVVIVGRDIAGSP